MNTGLFIANRLNFDKEGRRALARPIIRITVAGIALSLAVMIISVSVVTGFKNEIRRKIIGFGSHIQITNYDANSSFETAPVQKQQPFLPALASVPGIRHIQVFATKPGIIRTATEIQGAILKGIGSDFDWSFFEENLVAGAIFNVSDSVRTDRILISGYLSRLLRLNVGDRFAMYFIDEVPRGRSFEVSGIYETSLAEFDRQFILADIAHVQSLNGWSSGQVSGFEVLIDDYDDLDELSYETFRLAGTDFKEDGSRLLVMSIRDRYPQIFDWLGLIDKNVWVLLGLMLVVAAFNMISGLLILILDRTVMIGVLKALGMSNRGIRSIFLYQSAYLMLKGMFWGNMVGLGLSMLQRSFSILKLNPESYFIEFVPVDMDAALLILVNLGTLLITLLVLIIPSMAIARVSPASTIRFD